MHIRKPDRYALVLDCVDFYEVRDMSGCGGVYEAALEACRVFNDEELPIRCHVFVRWEDDRTTRLVHVVMAHGVSRSEAPDEIQWAAAFHAAEEHFCVDPPLSKTIVQDQNMARIRSALAHKERKAKS